MRIQNMLGAFLVGLFGTIVSHPLEADPTSPPITSTIVLTTATGAPCTSSKGFFIPPNPFAAKV